MSASVPESPSPLKSEPPAKHVRRGIFGWDWIVADHASMIWIALVAYAEVPEMYQTSASVYAAMASSRSSVQPKFGLE